MNVMIETKNILKSQLQNSGWMSGNPTLSPFSGWNEMHGGSMDRNSSSEMGQRGEAGRRLRVLQLALKASVMALITIGATGLPATASAAEYTVVIENHVFVPDRIEMTAGERHRLIVLNHDATPEEFESYELNREKVVAGNSKIVIFLPSLDAGEYPFFGEFNPDTAQGRIVVK